MPKSLQNQELKILVPIIDYLVIRVSFNIYLKYFFTIKVVEDKIIS
jgi:hypothetical protein